MVASWGGYIFVLNTIAIYQLLILLLGKFSCRHYVAYSIFYVLSTVLCLNIPFVNFQAIRSSEHLSSHGVFLVMNAYYIMHWISKFCSKKTRVFLTETFISGRGSAIFGLRFLPHRYW